MMEKHEQVHTTNLQIECWVSLDLAGVACTGLLPLIYQYPITFRFLRVAPDRAGTPRLRI